VRQERVFVRGRSEYSDRGCGAWEVITHRISPTTSLLGR
jgi:hypothetical protein